MTALNGAGFEVRSQIVWVKAHFALGRGCYHQGHEPAFFAVRKGAATHWHGDRKQTTVWTIPNLNPFGGSQSREDRRTSHSTQKPVRLFEIPILNHLGPAEAIYDPFCGSGSMLIAAEKTGRIGFCCLSPALRVARVAAVNALGARRGLGSSRASVRWRELLQIAQIAFMVVVLVQAGLFASSTWRLAHTPLGFDQTNLSYFDLRYPVANMIDAEGQYQTLSQLAAGLLSRPGVVSVALGGSPISPSVITEEMGAERRPDLLTETALSSSYVGPGYFRVTGIALKAGREFLPSDTSTSEKVVIINQRIAERSWPGVDPVGQRLLLYSPSTPYRVVGVVGDVKTVDVVRSDLQIYRPLLQSPSPRSLVIRARTEPRVLYGFVTGLLGQISPRVTVDRLSSVEGSLRETAPGAATAFFAILLAGLAVTGLLIALVGLCSTLSLNVEQRLGEIGVRVALGAAPKNVILLILIGVVRQLSVGLLLGLFGSRVVASYLSAQRFHVSSFDALTLVGVALVVICGGLVSTLAPIRLALSQTPRTLIAGGR